MTRSSPTVRLKNGCPAHKKKQSHNKVSWDIENSLTPFREPETHRMGPIGFKGGVNSLSPLTIESMPTCTQRSFEHLVNTYTNKSFKAKSFLAAYWGFIRLWFPQAISVGLAIRSLLCTDNTVVHSVEQTSTVPTHTWSPVIFVPLSLSSCKELVSETNIYYSQISGSDINRDGLTLPLLVIWDFDFWLPKDFSDLRPINTGRQISLLVYGQTDLLKYLSEGCIKVDI